MDNTRSIKIHVIEYYWISLHNKDKSRIPLSLRLPKLVDLSP